MDKQDFLSIFRRYLSDPEKRIWSDDELDLLLDDARKQYCIDSALFTGKFFFAPDADGVYHYPEDYGSFLIGWDKAGREIIPSSAAELFDKQGRAADLKGNARFIYDDHSSNGNFMLYPKPSDNQHFKLLESEDFYGEVTDDAFGVLLTDEFGTTLDIESFDYEGVIYYRRICDYEEIKDYMGVICYALHLAYNTNTDVGSAETATAWRQQYKLRISIMGNISKSNTGLTRDGNYY